MDEKELISMSLQGDEKAFEALINPLKDDIYHKCLGIVHDEEIAQDMTQETFLKAFLHLQDFRCEARFSTWVYRIAHNLCLNYLKKKHPFEGVLDEELIAEVPHVNEPEEAFLEQVRDVLKILPENQRIIVEMYIFQKIPQKEIAAKLGIPHGTVRSRLFYARKKIQDELKNLQ